MSIFDIIVQVQLVWSQEPWCPRIASYPQRRLWLVSESSRSDCRAVRIAIASRATFTDEPIQRQVFQVRHVRAVAVIRERHTEGLKQDRW
jgi:hypothetical protein